MMLLAVSRAAAGAPERALSSESSSSSEPPWRQKHTQLTSLPARACHRSVSAQQQNQGSHASIILLVPALAWADNPRFAQQQTGAGADIFFLPTPLQEDWAHRT